MAAMESSRSLPQVRSSSKRRRQDSQRSERSDADTRQPEQPRQLDDELTRQQPTADSETEAQAALSSALQQQPRLPADAQLSENKSEAGWRSPPEAAPASSSSSLAAASRDADSDRAVTQQASAGVHASSMDRSTPPVAAAAASSASPSSPLVPSASQGSVSAAAAAAVSSSSSSSSASACRTSQLRLQSDLKSLETDPPEGISASPLDATNLYLWRACIFGPEDTPWEGGVFQLQLLFPKEYPQKPPTVRFLSKMFHPNVFVDGALCLDIIQTAWSPIYSVSSILTSVQSLLTDPNVASPANPEAARMFAKDQKEYRKQVRACAAKAAL